MHSPSSHVIKLFRVFRELKRRLIIICLTTVAFPIAVLLKILRPVFPVNVGFFWVDRIGHHAFDIEYYLCESVNAGGGVRKWDLFYLEGKPANDHLRLMTAKKITCHPFIRYLFYANKLLPASHLVQVLPARIRNDSRDKIGLFKQYRPMLRFSDQENDHAFNLLSNIGLNPESKIVCLVVRESAYLAETFPNSNWDHHNFRDCDIQTYIDSAKHLSRLGYWVFRMGKIVNTEFKLSESRVVDYANSDYRSDFMDIWLMANCCFCISTGTGLDSVSDIFRRPVVYTNYDSFPLMVTWGDGITVPKRLVWRETGQELSIEEYFSHSFAHTNRYYEAGIDTMALSSEEITDAVVELEERVSGKEIVDQRDIELQKEFWKLFENCSDYPNYHGVRHPRAQVGRSYLRASYKSLFR